MSAKQQPLLKNSFRKRKHSKGRFSVLPYFFSSAHRGTKRLSKSTEASKLYGRMKVQVPDTPIAKKKNVLSTDHCIKVVHVFDRICHKKE